MSEILAEVWRGDFLESVHRGAVAVVSLSGGLVDGFGDAGAVILPRSSLKPIQALPLVERLGDALRPERIALACASHNGAGVHVDEVRRWLSDTGHGDGDLLCGPQPTRDAAEAQRRAGAPPANVHNNCSGKHAGFLALARQMGEAGAEYIDPDHPVQRAVLTAVEEMADEQSPGWAIDGCSAPNHALSLRGLAAAMARLTDGAGVRGAAGARILSAMTAHPNLVAGEGRACTDLIRAARGRAVVKTGAEGVFAAALPDLGLGVAIKIEDGATRAANCAMAAMLVRLGVVAAQDPLLSAHLSAPVTNWRGTVTGRVAASASILERPHHS